MAQKYGTHNYSKLLGMMTDEERRKSGDLYTEYLGREDENWNTKEPTRILSPAVPLEKNWHEVAMKRMLRLAAEEGFDKVAWTTGEQQADECGIRRC